MIRDWHKSSYSTTDGECVEVRSEQLAGATTVDVRDTKSRFTGQLGFSGQAWDSFVRFATR